MAALLPWSFVRSDPLGPREPGPPSAPSPSVCPWSGVPANVPEMECGLLAFVHIVKTGGEAVWSAMEYMASQTKWRNISVWDHNALHYNHAEDPEWIELNRSVNADKAPRIVLQIHNGGETAPYFCTSRIPPSHR